MKIGEDIDVTVKVSAPFAFVSVDKRFVQPTSTPQSEGKVVPDILTPAPIERSGPLARYDDVKTTLWTPTQTDTPCTGHLCKFELFRLTQKTPSGKEIAFELSTHLGGAIYRVVYGGVDFVLPVSIVGASMQTAMSFDIRTQLGMNNEQYNPTEGGVSSDSFSGRPSSTKILQLAKNASSTAVYTRAIPAYFRPPGYLLKDKTTGKNTLSVLNTTILSKVVHSKRLEFVEPGVLDYTMNIVVKDGYFFSQVEILADWVPPNASAKRAVLTSNGWKAPEDYEIFWVKQASLPRTYGFVNSTADEQIAMGVMLMDYPKTIPGGPRFDSPRYNSEGSTADWRKFNMVQRLGDRENFTIPIPGGVYGWRTRFIFGTMTEVRTKMQAYAGI